MNKEFVTYEQALALKELGFNEPCFGYFNTYSRELFLDNSNNRTSNDDDRWCSAPLYQQVFRWFREKYKINSQIAFCEYAIESCDSWKFTFNNPTGQQYWNGEFKTYEEAEPSCLDKLIEICKNK